MNDLVLLINRLLNVSWLFVLVGVIHALVREYRSVAALVDHLPKKKKRNHWELWKPIIRRLYYVVGGFALILLAWAIVDTLFTVLVPANLATVDLTGITEVNIVTFAKMQLHVLSTIAVYGMVLSGAFLTISAGTRWLVNTAKLLATATIIYVLLMVFFAYMPIR